MKQIVLVLLRSSDVSPFLLIHDFSSLLHWTNHLLHIYITDPEVAAGVGDVHDEHAAGHRVLRPGPDQGPVLANLAVEKHPLGRDEPGLSVVEESLPQLFLLPKDIVLQGDGWRPGPWPKSCSCSPVHAGVILY